MIWFALASCVDPATTDSTGLVATDTPGDTGTSAGSTADTGPLGHTGTVPACGDGNEPIFTFVEPPETVTLSMYGDPCPVVGEFAGAGSTICSIRCDQEWAVTYLSLRECGAAEDVPYTIEGNTDRLYWGIGPRSLQDDGATTTCTLEAEGGSWTVTATFVR